MPSSDGPILNQSPPTAPPGGSPNHRERLVIGITGASGSLYARRLIEYLHQTGDFDLHVVATDMAQQVFACELGQELAPWLAGLSRVTVHDHRDLFAPIASGSYRFRAMVVLPCSMHTLSEISQGLSGNLLSRAADVAIKEKRPLILVPRETPLHAIHLENMLRLARLNVTILPAMPGFYHQPATLDDLVDFVVGKILDHLDIPNQLFKKWE